MQQRNNDFDWGGWLFTIIMLGVFWPVGLVMLFRQLTGYNKRGTRRRHPYDVQQAQRSSQYQQQQQQQQPTAAWSSAPAKPQAAPARPQAAQTGKQSAAQANGWNTVKKTTKDRKADSGAGRVLTIVGASIAGIFGLALMMELGDIFAYGFYSHEIQGLFFLTGCFGSGLACLYAGHCKRKQAKRFKKYLSYIGKNKVVSLSALAAAMGVKEKHLYDDLQDMLDKGVLPMGYIDLAAGELVLSDKGISNEPRQAKAEPEPEAVKKTVDDENAILQEIREVNDAIPDAVMSAKIDRIGEITGKILDYQRSHPSKSGQLRSFLNYYLPTTLKILRAYAQLDAQGIEGENITAAKKRIENMMDQVVDGFEKQLDKLFADDALDISADVQVLENMLRKDGLSGDGMTLSSGPVSTGDGFSPQQAYLDLKKVADELDAQAKQSEDDGQITLQL